MRRATWLFLLMSGCGNNAVDDTALGDGGTAKHDMAMQMGDGGTNPGSGAWFPDGNPWSKSVAGSNGTVAADSNDVIMWLANNGGWGNGNVFQIDLSFHILEADSSTPQLPFMEAQGYTLPDCDEMAKVPIPAMGAIEGSTDYTCDAANNDCHLLVVDRSAKKLYEMYQSNIANNVVSSTCLVIWDLTKVYPPSERGEQCTSADAAGYPIAPLLFTADEVAAGHIDHAIRFALPNNRMRSKLYMHPASHAGGPSAGGTAPIYGSHFRLRQDFPVDSLPSPAAKVIATALMNYGMFLADGGNIALMGTDDQFTKAKWADPNVNLDTHDLKSIKVTDFELMAHDAPIPLTYDCVRN
jgi:serine/threonine-protein kinase